MNNAPLTLILIASLGIVAVVSLGVFFALRPKGVVDDTVSYANDDYLLQHQTTGVPEPEPNVAKKPLSKHGKKVHIQTGPSVGKPKSESTTPEKTERKPIPEQPPEPTTVTTEPQDEEKLPLTTIELDSLRAAPVPKNTVAFEWERSSTDKNTNEKFRLAKLMTEKDMRNYGKIVGLAYSRGKLFVPSYQYGNISVMSTPDLTSIVQYQCPNKCHIYDIGILSNGEIILTQGKNEKLTKLDSKGKLVKEINLQYSTKGLAVSQFDEIFVLPKQHDTIYVYDAELTELGVIPLQLNDLPVSADCNFLDYQSDTLYISCEPAIYALDIQGNLKFSVKPSNKGTFGVGLTVDKNDRLLAGLRGTEAVDVFNKAGQYQETVGDTKDSLWSDIVAGDNNTLYVVDYISATIKVYRY